MVTPPLPPSASGLSSAPLVVGMAGCRWQANAGMIRRGCARRAGWVPLVMAAAWLAVVLLAGCSSQRLPSETRYALTMATQASAQSLRAARATSRPEAAVGPLIERQSKVLAVLCEVVKADAREGRGWVEWVIGLAGLDSGPSGELDAATSRACGGAG